ncbi:MAG: DUF4113 domain-containing protein, partial [candidate division WOR-3 bacterium]|nr:DUF4113 domain-containing protein [candidate division WOR-3 bacterium]
SLTGFNYLSLTEYAKHIKNTVKKWTGIPVSIGIGPTKTLAKLARKIAKRSPDYEGVFNLTDHPAIDNLLDTIEVNDIWGIGSQYAKFLNRNNIYTAFQLKNASHRWIKKNMTVVGLRTVMELRGISCIPLEQMPPPRKTIMSSRSFGKPVKTLTELKEAVAAYVTIAAEKLREQDTVASVIHVFLTTNFFKEEPHYSNFAASLLPVPTAATSELISHAHKNLEKVFKKGYLYKRAGVMLTGIGPANQIQSNLFNRKYYDNCRKPLLAMIDELNTKLGNRTIQYAAEGIEKNWRMRQAKKTPRFTTQWTELPLVKA